MTKFHPETYWLAEYAAGSLDDSHALCVAAHLQHCPACKSEVDTLASVGAAIFSALFSDNEPQKSGEQQVITSATCQIDDTNIEKALARLDQENSGTQSADMRGSQSAEPAAGSTLSSVTETRLPAAFRKLAPDGLDHLSWKHYGNKLSIAELGGLDAKREVALHRLQPGSSVAHHDHSGREITVVLSGSFSDTGGQYNEGDFVVREPGEKHRPTASETQGCVCLSVTDAPVRFTGLLTRLLNPVIALRHPS